MVHSISTVMLDPTGGNTPVMIRDITDVVVVTGSGEEISLGLGGYLDIGILDTMKDLLVNFVGAVVFLLYRLFLCEKTGERAGLPAGLFPKWWMCSRRMRRIPRRRW